MQIAPAAQAVKDRYAEAAKAREVALCCPVDYDPQYLKIIPAEVIERDYGCGDPSTYVREGDVVLDLGAGGGKICFIAAQIVGPQGRVIGVDMTPDMLELSRRSASTVAEAIGHNVTEFRHGRIEDLKLDLDEAELFLKDHPVASAEGLADFETHADYLRREAPMIADGSVDIVLSNCVLNLVGDAKKDQLFAEIFRVLKPGGRIAVSDIVSDEPTPHHMKDDPELWSGCISGALETAEFAAKLEAAGFKGIALDKYEVTPWQVVEGITYRSVTYTAVKPSGGCCCTQKEILYTGPFKSITDDDGNVLERGIMTTVSVRAHRVLMSGAYGKAMIDPESEGSPDGGCC